jgi:hypothetical protein
VSTDAGGTSRLLQVTTSILDNWRTQQTRVVEPFSSRDSERGLQIRIRLVRPSQWESYVGLNVNLIPRVKIAESSLGEHLAP